ncbi:unnamed protein product, partial [marine sediment metagenome]
LLVTDTGGIVEWKSSSVDPIITINMEAYCK